MSYELGFMDDALSDWRKLDGTVREQFKKKLAERLETPRVLSAKLFGHPDRYKIELRSVGFRLVHEVRDLQLLVVAVAVAVGKRERSAVYKAVDKR